MCLLEGRSRPAMQPYFTEAACVIIRVIGFLINFDVTSVLIHNV